MTVSQPFCAPSKCSLFSGLAAGPKPGTICSDQRDDLGAFLGSEKQLRGLDLWSGEQARARAHAPPPPLPSASLAGRPMLLRARLA